MTAWLDVIGLGEDGRAGLSAAACARLDRAEIVVGSDRHHALLPDLAAKRVRWPSPFRAMLDEIEGFRPRPTAVLVTGDPLWYSVGAQFVRRLPQDQVTVHPQLSAFQLAAARMGWSLADVETLTAHGRRTEQILPHVAPGAQLLILAQDGGTPEEVAALLCARGFGASRLTVLAHLGGPRENRSAGRADTWSRGVDDLHVLAVECEAGQDAQILPRTGLRDDAFAHDGQMTKREFRVLALAALAPRRGAVLWDIGAGCGSIGVEWLRAAPDTEAHAIEPDPDRRALAKQNAMQLGAPRLRLVEGRAPEALRELPAPDAVFIGGGLSRDLAKAALAALRPHGRLVAHAVTLESEAILADLQADLGGHLTRISVERAAPVGRMRGWRPAMPVTQWALTT